MITIVDYGMGNLRSVQKAFEHIGFSASIAQDPETIANASKLVLPGVGAFRDAIGEIEKRNLVEPIKDHIQANKPFFGICLGLQLLFDVSYEDGTYQGLGIIPGEVVKFELPRDYKVPHMGWNQIAVQQKNRMTETVSEGDYFYFVHSYFVRPAEPEHIALSSNYGDSFCAAIARDNLFATQFHPEKSQTSGLALLKQFATTA